MGKKHLTLEKREILARLLSEGMSIRNIAHILGFSPSAISQEVRRNSLKDGRYVPKSAQEKARIRRLRANRERQPVDTALYAYIKEKLSFCWSPEQIVGRLRKDFPTAHRMRISFKNDLQQNLSRKGCASNRFCPLQAIPPAETCTHKKL
jgi:IS30 family transposase